MKRFTACLSEFWKTYYRDLFSALTLAVMLGFLFPVSVYQKNSVAIDFNLNDILPRLSALTLAIFAVGALVVVIVHKYIFKYVGMIYYAAAVCLWAQGNLLAYDLGPLNGGTVNWGKFGIYYFVEAALWVSMIAAMFWFRKSLYRYLISLLVMLLLAEAGSILTGSSPRPVSAEQNQKLYFSHDKEFDFSADKNVVVIIIDTARADAFEQILARNPAYQTTFKDFTFFENTAGGFSITKPSIPLILSGKYFNNSLRYSEYLKDTQDDSLPGLLKKNGYTVEYYSFAPFSYLDVWDNGSMAISRVNIETATQKLYLVAFLRHLPLPFKPYVLNQYYAGEDYWGKDMVELYKNVSNTKKVNKGPVFKFIHLTGAHPLFLLDRSLNLSSDTSYIDQLEGSLLAVDSLFKEMKAAGVYDNSLILVMGDHGSTEPWDVRKDLQSLTTAMLNGLPMLVAKDFNQNQTAMAYSEIPASLMDIPKTVIDDLGIKNDLPGMSIFSDIPSSRVRTYFYYNHWQQISNAEYLPELYQYNITGHARDFAAWQFLGKSQASDGTINSLDKYYRYGGNIVSPESFYIENFSYGFREENEPGAWATGPFSCLYLPVAQTSEPLTLSFTVTPFLSGFKLPLQRMNVVVDGHFVDSYDLRSHNSWSLPLPFPDLTDDNQIKLCFEFPDAKYSPKDLGQSTDFRYYGGYFDSIELNTESSSIALPTSNPPSEPVSKFLFGVDGNADAIKKSGWSNNESGFTWTSGKNASLSIPLEMPADGRDLTLTVQAMPFISANLKEQKVIVRSNGQELGQWKMDHSGEYMLSIPYGSVVGGALNLEFEIPNAASPVSLGVNNDTRILGMAVHWLEIEE